tara:strand:+ start:804 stop:1178 length:375 start_codon:yes stop_codon:yes gene_type:complete
MLVFAAVLWLDALTGFVVPAGVMGVCGPIVYVTIARGCRWQPVHERRFCLASIASVVCLALGAVVAGDNARIAVVVITMVLLVPGFVLACLFDAGSGESIGQGAADLSYAAQLHNAADDASHRS